MLISLAISGKVKRIIWSSNGKYLAIRGGNGEFKLFDSIKNKVIAEATGEGSRSEFVFSGDSRFFAIIRNGKRLQRLKVVELFGGNRTHSLPMTKSGISVTVNPDNEHIAIALEDNTAEIWNLKTKLRANHIILDFGVEDIAFTPDGKYIVGRSNKYNKSAKAWIG